MPETEAKLTACLDRAADALVLLDGGWHIAYANPALAALAGRPEAKLQGESFWPLFPEWADAPLGDALRRAVDEHTATQGGPHLTPDGRWIEFNAVPADCGVFVTLRDASERRRSEDARRDAEERSRFALASTHMGTWEWLLASNTVRWSEELVRLHGRPPGVDGSFDVFLNDIDPKWQPGVLAALRACVDEGRDLHMQYLLRRPDGSTGWIEAHGRLIRDELGQPQRVIGVCADISERKQIEQALRDSEEAHRFLTESIPTQVWTSRPDGQLDHVNRQVLEYFERTAAEIIGEGWQGVIHPADLAECVKRWTRSLTTGEPYEVEFRLRRADGEYRWHIGRARPLRDADGQIVRWFGTNTDIDEQKRVGQAQRFIIDASNALAASLDYETTLTSVAHLAVPEIADWCAVDLIDRDDPDHLRRVTVAHVDPSKVALAHELHRRYPIDMSAQTGVPQVIRSGKPEMYPVIEDWMLVQGSRDPEELRIVRELGLTSSMCVPLKARGRTLGAISLIAAEPGRHFDDGDLRVAEALALRCAVAIDNAILLRQAQEAEQDLRRLNEDLERRVVERTADVKRGKERVEEANVRLKELDTMKDEFLGALSYQLASPINAVIGYTDLLLEGAGGALREEQRRYVRRITASSKVLLSLVHDLLDMSRMSAGKFDLDRESLDPGALAREVLDFVEPLTEMQGLRVVSRVADDLRGVPADAQRLEQVLANVLHNAIQLTSSGGLLRLSVERAGEMVRFEVHHTGTALAAEDLERIFRRYTRLGGAWLGLSIASRIIEAHGGKMGVEPNAGGSGNTFWFTIPLLGRP